MTMSIPSQDEPLTNRQVWSSRHSLLHERSEQAFAEYASSHKHDMENRKFTTNQGPWNFNEATNTFKDKPNFNWDQTQTFTSPQNGSISTHSSNYQIKLEKALDDFDSHQEKSKESEAKEGETMTDITPEHDHNITKEAKDEVKEVMEEDESEVETDWEVEEIPEEEKEDEDDTTNIIDRHLREMAFGRPFIDETGLVYDREEGTVKFD
ncbi:hypothetical protein Tco_1448283 [Tanacetum coccineum]